MFNFIAEISTLIRATVWLTCLVPLIGFVQPTEAGSKRKPSVLILHTSTPALDTQAKLAATGLFGAVDLFNAAASESATPSLAQLLPYDAVLVSPDYAEPFADNVALGNNLADYVDAGTHARIARRQDRPRMIGGCARDRARRVERGR